MKHEAWRHPDIRKLWPHERRAYLAHLLRLDPESRRLRFGAPITDHSVRSYAEATFGVEGPTFGLVLDGKVRAAGELRGSFEWPRIAAEAAFSVEPPWRRQGVGAALFAVILEAARNRGFREIVLTCLPENAAMRALVRRHGGRIACETCETSGRVRLETATPSSLLGEIAGDARAMLRGARTE